jgi:hypothetical protein
MISYYPLQFSLYYFLVYRAGWHTSDYKDFSLFGSADINLTIKGLGSSGIWLAMLVAVSNLLLWELMLLIKTDWKAVA